MWYAVQVQTGKEERLKTLIERIAFEKEQAECRLIYYEIKKKYKGKWHVEKKNMFPGYLFVISDNIEALGKRFCYVTEMTKILKSGDEYLPLSEREEEFLRHLSSNADVVRLSYGIEVGDRVIIKRGTLKGYESRIKKIDRHKRKAIIEIEMFGQMRTAEVGLEITEKK